MPAGALRDRADDLSHPGVEDVVERPDRRIDDASRLMNSCTWISPISSPSGRRFPCRQRDGGELIDPPANAAPGQLSHLCYGTAVARTISQRELRNQSGEIMRGLDRGEEYTITRTVFRSACSFLCRDGGSWVSTRWPPPSPALLRSTPPTARGPRTRRDQTPPGIR